jgi:hypothetical protein
MTNSQHYNDTPMHIPKLIMSFVDKYDIKSISYVTNNTKIIQKHS